MGTEEERDRRFAAGRAVRYAGFSSPSEVVDDDYLSSPQKRALLAGWKKSIQMLPFPSETHASILRQIDEAIARLAGSRH